MEGTSSSGGGPLDEAAADVKSPMSDIVHNLSKSSLDSGGTKKRHFSRLKGSFGASHRANDQKSEGVFPIGEDFQKLNQISRTVPEPFWDPRGWGEPATGKYNCNKENSGAANSSYSRTPQRTRHKKVRHPLKNHEENSQDSGHGSSPISDMEEKRRDLYATVGAAASRSMSMDYKTYSSRTQCDGATFRHPLKTASSSSFLRSLSSGYESMDDGLVNELIDMETMDKETQLPANISKLLSGEIVAPETSTDYDVSTTPDFSRNVSPRIENWYTIQSGTCKRSIKTMSPPVLRPPLPARSPSMTRSPSMMTSPPVARSPSLMRSSSLSKIRTCLFNSPATAPVRLALVKYKRYDDIKVQEHYYKLLPAEVSPPSARSYKRPSEDSPEDETSILKRSRKTHSMCLDATPVSARRSSTLTRSKFLQRSLSETEAHANIKWAIHRSITDTDLIGDFSKPCILPLTMGHHSEDLKAVTSDTLAALLRGEFNDRVRFYKIIDCRYPYEYEGGHIDGALNLYNEELIQKTMLDHLSRTVPRIQPDTAKRNIVVFHCEFSCERGPNLSRMLRRLDRSRNKDHYPALHYPEIYLLQGGYEKFYSEQKEFCSPQNYKPMKHPNHEEECRFFRSKSKSWQGDKVKGYSQTVRANLERLGF